MNTNLISRKRGFLIGKMSKIKVSKSGKKLSIASLVLLLNIFHLAVAAAPSEPISPTFENLTQITSLIAVTPLEKNNWTVMVAVTAYSSTQDQTDDTPFITAANTITRDGIVASNFLPLHTKIMIPELFSDKVFLVEDRMHERFDDRLDIWFPDRESAKEFGLKIATIRVL